MGRLGSSEVVAEIIGELKPRVEGLVLEDVRIGLFYTGVKLSDGSGGVAYTPREWLVKAFCCPEIHERMPLAGELSGTPVTEAMNLAQEENLLFRAVGVATINAASSKHLFQEEAYKVEYDVDALQGVEVGGKDKVVMVGAFKPYILALRERGTRLTVYDNNPALLREVGLPEKPEKELAEALKEADIVIVTGSAFVVSNIDEILRNCKEAREVILVGPSSSMLPDPLFKRKVTVLGGLRIIDAEEMLRIVSEAGGTKSLLKQAAKKFVVKARGLAGSAERR